MVTVPATSPAGPGRRTAGAVAGAGGTGWQDGAPARHGVEQLRRGQVASLVLAPQDQHLSVRQQGGGVVQPGDTKGGGGGGGGAGGGGAGGGGESLEGLRAGTIDRGRREERAGVGPREQERLAPGQQGGGVVLAGGL